MSKRYRKRIGAWVRRDWGRCGMDAPVVLVPWRAPAALRRLDARPWLTAWASNTTNPKEA